MKRFATLFPLALVAVLAVAAPAAAQSGQLSGTVRDAQTGETLPGVNVRIDGTTQGAATNVNGEYRIIGVRPGEYTLLATFVGFQPQRVEGVRVRIDLTTTTDIALTPEVFGGEEVVVTAERALFQRDVTATTATVSGDEIRAIPVENFADVVALQAGVVNSGSGTHFRGGRSGEVGYWVDGVPVSDAYSGGLTISLENESVQEVQVVTGAFNAEYGQALSGIVNVVTRDGSNDFEGEIEVWGGDYLARTGASAAGIVSDLELFPGLGAGSFTPGAVRNAEGALGGPILRDRLFFFGSGRYFANDGYRFGRDVFRAGDIGFAGGPDGNGTGQPLFIAPSGSGDSSLVALDPYERLSGQFKLTANLPAGMRLSLNTLLSDETFRDFSFANLLYPEASRTNRRGGRTGILKFTHLLSARTFYEVGLTNNFSRFRSNLFEDPFDARYRDDRLLGTRVSTLFTPEFALGGTDNGRFERTTNTWLAKLDVSSQVHPAHLVKTGIEFRRHGLSFLDQFTSVQERFDAEGRPLDPAASPDNRIVNLVTNGQYRRSPVEFSAYVQDKIEVGGLIINAGIRADYFDSNGVVFADPTDPATVFPNLRACVRVENGRCVANEAGEIELRDDPFTPDELFEAATPTFQVSPRLGVAFPITAGGVVHFSFGQFFQTPNFELLYQNPYFLLGSQGSGLVGLIGNANLRPEQTINGEIGLKQELSASSAVEVTAYFRDIRNLAGTATDPIQIEGSSARYGRLVNSDFGFVRGIILRYDQRIGRALSAGVDYTFQVARANASDPALAFNAAAANSQLEQQIVPTDWDQRHTVNASASYFNERLDAGLGLIVNVGSGLPFTPSTFAATLAGQNPPTVVPLNSETRRPQVNINFDAYRNVRLPGGTNVQVYTKVDNLLDTRNENGIFGDTGRATYTLRPNADVGAFSGDPALLEQRYLRPDFFSQPRRVVLGLRFQF